MGNNPGLKSSPLEGLRIAMVLPPVEYREEELHHPLKVFRDGGATVDILSAKTGRATGMRDGSVPVARRIEDQRIEELQALLVIGGDGTRLWLWENEALQRLLRRAFERQLIVGGICHGVVPLARAGILRDRPATCYEDPQARRELWAAGARFVEEPLVIDYRTVTARGPSAARSFGWAVRDLLSGTD